MFIVAAIAGVYLLLMAGVTLNQRHLMYFPSKFPLPVMEQAADERHCQLWTNDKGVPIGWKRLATAPTAAGQVLILHGNGGHALLWTDFADRIQQIAAYDVYILEFPGYGSRPGQPSEKSIFDAATEALSLLSPNRKTYLVGESLGTGVAAYLAGANPQRINGLILLAPYNNMSALAQHHIKIFPVRWILWDRYSSDDYLKKYSGPVGILVGGKDQVIPSRYGRKLYDGYHGPKRLWEEPLAGHEDMHHRSVEWWRDAFQFLEQNPALEPGK